MFITEKTIRLSVYKKWTIESRKQNGEEFLLRLLFLSQIETIMSILCPIIGVLMIISCPNDLKTSQDAY